MLSTILHPRQTALREAASLGDTVEGFKLLQQGTDVNARDSQGNTPLHCAARSCQDDFIGLLLGFGAEVQPRNKAGVTPLHDAALNTPALMRGMLSMSTPWMALAGGVPASLQTLEKPGVSTIRLLVQNGAVVDTWDNMGQTPLHYAALRGNDDLVVTLLQLGAEINLADNVGFTALHLAATHGHATTVKLLLDQGANPIVLNSLEKSPFQVASSQEVKDVLTRSFTQITAKANGAMVRDVLGKDRVRPKDAARSRAPKPEAQVSGMTRSERPRSEEPTQERTALKPARQLKARSWTPQPETPHSVMMARSWISMAKDHISAGKTQKYLRKTNPRVRIAVLDTGVDLENEDISIYGKRIKFLGGDAEANKDRDGHGTLVVQLLLGLAANIEVYVHKIAETRGSLDLSVEKIHEIAELIKETAQPPRVSESKLAVGIDILNLSFGFPDADEPKLQPLREAFYHVHTVHQVLILAASRNDGGNASVMWPASEQGCVICVNSSDGIGNPSPFNPTQPEPRFCTLGEGLELRLTPGMMGSTDESAASSQPTEAQVRVESGTSFATPVAAALVATILDFVESNAKTAGLDDRQKQRLRRLRTRQGMLQVLKERCVESSLATRNGYHYIAPWFFKLEPWNIHGILESLGRAW